MGPSWGACVVSCKKKTTGPVYFIIVRTQSRRDRVKKALKKTYKYQAVPDNPTTATQRLLNSNWRSSVCTVKTNEKGTNVAVELSCRVSKLFLKYHHWGLSSYICFIKKHTIYESTDVWKNMSIQVDKNLLFFFFVREPVMKDKQAQSCNSLFLRGSTSISQ